jgi:uncharacterized protein (DUF305 family)
MKRILLLAVALLTAAALAACSQPADPHAGHDTSSSASEPAASPSEQDGGADFTDADVMFAQMMIPHHEQAMEMSDLVLGKDGVDPQVTELAAQIKAAQGPEIDQLEEWLESWGADRAGEHAGHGMSGMLSEEDMQALADAEGADAGRLFLEQMIAHHEGAVSMAQAQIEDGRHEGAVEMARAIVETQTAEIETMRELLG